MESEWMKLWLGKYVGDDKYMSTKDKAPMLFIVGVALGGGFYFYQMFLNGKSFLESFRISFPEVPIATIVVFLVTSIVQDKIKELVIELKINSSGESDLIDYLSVGGESSGVVRLYIFLYRATAFMAGLVNSIVGSFFFLGR